MIPSLWPDDNSAKADEAVKVMFHKNPDQPESPVVTVEGWKSEQSYYRQGSKFLERTGGQYFSYFSGLICAK